MTGIMPKRLSPQESPPRKGLACPMCGSVAEPTEEMIEAGSMVVYGHDPARDETDKTAEAVYRAMLSKTSPLEDDE